MDIQSLRYFVKIASGMTFLEVSEDFNCSQSSLSKAIHQLEAELGMPLFSREKRRAVLTQAGLRLYNHLLDLKPLYDQMLLDICDSSTKQGCKFYMEPTTHTLNLSYYIRAFNKKYSNVHITSAVPSLPNFMATYMNPYINRSYDFVITHRSMCPQDKCTITNLHDDYFVVLVAREFAKDFPEAVTCNELQNRVMISTETGQWCDYVRQRFCNAWGIIPSRVIRESRHREVVLNNLSNLGGIAVFYASDLQIFKLEKVVPLRILDVPPDPFVIVVQDHMPLCKEAKLFMQFLVETFQKTPIIFL
jgi:DNA-binding transcriptional LysR family regulator